MAESNVTAAMSDWERREKDRVERHLIHRLQWTTGLLVCHDCGGTQIYKYLENGDLQILHSCHAGRQVREVMLYIKRQRDELLEALKLAKEFIEDLQLPDKEWSRTLDACVSAIAKAEGRHD